jgi:hypothetical protein
MGATDADFSLGLCSERARLALRATLAGFAGHLHKTQGPRAQGAETTSAAPSPHQIPWSTWLIARSYLARRDTRFCPRDLSAHICINIGHRSSSCEELTMEFRSPSGQDLKVCFETSKIMSENPKYVDVDGLGRWRSDFSFYNLLMLHDRAHSANSFSFRHSDLEQNRLPLLSSYRT